MKRAIIDKLKEYERICYCEEYEKLKDYPVLKHRAGDMIHCELS